MGRAARDGNFVLTRLGTESLRTLRWRGLDSKFQFRPRVDEFRVGKSLPEERVDPVLLLEPLGARPTVGSALLRYIRILSEPHSQYHASASSNWHSVPLTSPPEIGPAKFVGGARWCRAAGDRAPWGDKPAVR